MSAEIRAACMGGWCAHRGQCPRHVTEERSIVVERFCERGLERLEYAPVRVEPAHLNRGSRVMRAPEEATACP